MPTFWLLLAAIICFAIDFLLGLAGVDVDRLRLPSLGWALVAAALLLPVAKSAGVT